LEKLWLRSAGEIVEVKVPRHALGRSGGVTITICYRYTYKNQPYAAEEPKALDVEYHREKESLDELLKQYPVGGKIVIFHPRIIPGMSSITPGGANVPKLIFAAIGAVGFLILAYYYAKAQATMD
jgi:hypothetical protein